MKITIPIDHENPCPNTNMIMGAVLAGASPAAVQKLARQLAKSEAARAHQPKPAAAGTKNTGGE